MQKFCIVLLTLLLVVTALLLTSCGKDVKNNPLYTLTISVEGNGSVTPPSGSQFDENTIVQLIPTPDTGYKFDVWGGADGELVSEDNEILMTKDMSITAGFI